MSALTHLSFSRRAQTGEDAPTTVVRALFLTLKASHLDACKLCDKEACFAGEVAAAALRALVGRYSIICEVLKTDRYKRAVARCTRPATLFQRQVDLGEWMLERGHAVVYRCCCITSKSHGNCFACTCPGLRLSYPARSVRQS